VRQLASRTTEATEEIINVVKHNQTLATDAVNLVNKVMKRRNQGSTTPERRVKLSNKFKTVQKKSLMQ